MRKKCLFCERERIKYKKHCTAPECYVRWENIVFSLKFKKDKQIPRRLKSFLEKNHCKIPKSLYNSKH